MISGSNPIIPSRADILRGIGREGVADTDHRDNTEGFDTHSGRESGEGLRAEAIDNGLYQHHADGDSGLLQHGGQSDPGHGRELRGVK